MSKIRIGAIGVGGIGGHQFRIAINNCSDLFQPIAVCDNNEGIAKHVANEFKIDAHTDYKELCKRDDIDAVITALPHYLYGIVDASYRSAKEGTKISLDV